MTMRHWDNETWWFLSFEKLTSHEPRNIKQMKNRKQKLKSSSKHNKQEQQTNDEFTALFNGLEKVNIVQVISAVNQQKTFAVKIVAHLY